MTPALRLWTIFTLLTRLRQATAHDATLQSFKESPGLYYDHVGEAQLYNTEWRIVTYVNLQEADQNLESVKKYARLSVDFCKNHEHTYWVNFTDCSKSTRYVDRQVKEVEDFKLFVRQLIGIDDDRENLRFKTGVFNFIGGISKILFGTMDSEDVSYYAEKISNVEKEQTDFLELSKEQITAVKPTLRPMTSTLLAVSDGEGALSRALDEMAEHVNERDGEIKEMFTAASMLLTINENTMQLESAINKCRREYNILIDAIMNSQKGVLQPHIITPAQIIKQMKPSQADMPSEFLYPYH
jgi:hypothetical protein